jgi:hypothetical protein
MSLLNQYKSGLKVIEAEEFVDLFFFRPFAFIFVKIIYPTNLTPNQITIISMIFGILAGISIAFGTVESVLLGGILFTISCILDCADGQLARLKKSGTKIGRLLDGIIDYISTISVFIGIGFWGAANFSTGWFAENPYLWWGVVVLTGLTYAFQAGFVDYYRSEYISNADGKSDFVNNELDEFQNEYDKIKNENGKIVNKILLALYIYYSKIQGAKKNKKNEKHLPPEDYIKNNKLLIRLWNLNGTSTHAFVLIVCAFINQLDWFIWYILFFGNICTIFTLMLQKYSDTKAIKEFEAVPEEHKL